MLTILHLFGRSPFSPLQSHMEQVSQCVQKIPDLFDCLQKQEFSLLNIVVKQISDLEHHADVTKNDIRNHLPKTLYLPMSRGDLLEILGLQDDIADRAEDLAVLLTLKKVALPEFIKDDILAFMSKNIETFLIVRSIINDLQDLLESSFGGTEAEKVRVLVEEVSFHEHEADQMQLKLLKTLYEHDKELHFSEFLLWQKILETLGDISNLSEKLAYRVRMTLDVK